MGYTLRLSTLLALVFLAGLPGAASANTTTVVLPNGGECLTVSQTYTIEFSWSGADVKHVALYYRTDGQQPAHLDASTIKHPINVPQQGTTYNWKPVTGDISETGRIWIDGHEAGHASLNTWDSSNADFAVRSSCAAQATAAVGGRGKVLTTPPPPGGFDQPARVVEVLSSTRSARLRFSVPWEETLYRVRLIRAGGEITVAQREVVAGPDDIIEFFLADLEPNALHPYRYYIQAYAPFTLHESVPSELTPLFRTLIEDVNDLELKAIAPTGATVAIQGSLSRLGEGLSAVWFENLTTAKTSGWVPASVWELTGLSPDTQYQVWAKARNGTGIETASSSPLTFRTPPLPAPPRPPEEPIAEGGEGVGPIQRAEEELSKEQGERLLKIIAGLKTEIEELSLRLQEGREVFLARVLAPPPEVVRVLPPQLPSPPPAPLSKPAPPPEPSPPPPPPPRAPQTFVVVIDDRGFNPQVLEIRVGDTVRWISRASKPFWPASDPHPTHTALPGFDALGDLIRGESYRYTFRKPGSVAYHNHTVAKAEEEPEAGVIVVRE